jgi:hypothetical protein
MACCLVVGAFASPALAKLLVVTTLDDTADSPFNEDGPCGTGTIANLPGDDGLVSLREAIIAANNTPGADTTTFASSLSGGMIEVEFDDLDADTDPDPLPLLCGGQTRINGDLNGDDIPDITLEGAAFPAATSVSGLAVFSSHNAIQGLQVQHFPNGVVVVAGLLGPGTVKHTTVRNNILTESTLDGIVVLTGDAPGSVLADTTITQNLVTRNARFGIFVLANLTAAGTDTQIAQISITDNEVRENLIGLYMQPQGAHNRVTDLTIAGNTLSENAFWGIQMYGGVGEAKENVVQASIRDNTVTDNGGPGIRLVGGGDNSANNHVKVKINKNTLERNQPAEIVVRGGSGEETFPGGGASVHNKVDVRIEQNALKNHGVGISVFGGSESVANNNQVTARVQHNVVEGSTVTGIELAAGGSGVANDNTLEVRVAHNTVCGDGPDIVGEGGFSGSILLPANQGSGNLLGGDISKNTATEVTVADGTPGNTALVTQSNNVPCP